MRFREIFSIRFVRANFVKIDVLNLHGAIPPTLKRACGSSSSGAYCFLSITRKAVDISEILLYCIMMLM